MTYGLSVLIVDDEPDLAEEMVDSVTGAGYVALMAHSAGEADGLLRLHPEIAVMITDVRMPGRDGLTLTRDALRLRGEADALEVILVTGHATLENAMDAVGSGAFRMLLKPARLDQLIATLGPAMARATGRRRLEVQRATLPDGANACGPTLMAQLGVTALGALSHELRTPLVGVVGYGELIQQFASEATVRTYAAEVVRIGLLLRNRIDTMLLFSRLMTVKTALRPGPVRLCGLVHHAAQAGQEHARAQNSLLRALPEADGVALADEEYLAAAYLALLDASLSFTPPGATMVTWNRRRGSEAWLGLDVYVDNLPDPLPLDLDNPVDSTPALAQVAPLSIQFAQTLAAESRGRVTFSRARDVPWRVEFRLPAYQGGG